MTELIKLNMEKPDSNSLKRARDVLASGGVIAYPTDTLYGLGADAGNREAVERVRDIKGKAGDSPILIIAADTNMAKEWVQFNDYAEELAQRLWPGPLTLILRLRSENLGYLVGSAAGLAVRVPGLELARRLCTMLGEPITSTSANLSGGENNLSAGEIKNQLGAKIDMILDAGPIKANPGSTIIDLTGDTPRLIREGVIPAKEVMQLN